MFAVDLKPFAPSLRKRDVNDVIYDPGLDDSNFLFFPLPFRLRVFPYDI